MTPASKAAKRAGIAFQLHRYQHDAAAASYGLEAVEKLNLPASQVFKTLVVELSSQALVVAVLPVDRQLNLKQLAALLTAKKAKMANPDDVKRSTGYVLGGVSPLGQRKALATVIDRSALAFDTIFVSAGQRGLEIELSGEDLRDLTSATVADIGSV
ncbi:Cys-tRNA(Pro)/Cys-tRNA(Cys) deacylase YbaK [Sinobacterium norvegicum]|uniref:Cys-tRNA(Pro)/Cys-tRNA(Cys) deacylase n=1 Tax=Sinobacterium norvegicum TaxID=1641715 RepID=A0ABM9AB19_9GAMM|nr:Cys-tRNA(Pro) deacylase [Sinobacterium norvegicum]CAH0990075.1 Cys-tRNA(Pro)/Cys-tRNA(Cys) deacylase YbaK [Sinobacterium norvegicum]